MWGYREEAFEKFVVGHATVIFLSFDGTPTRLYRDDAKAGNLNVYVGTLTAYAPNGESRSLQPELSAPRDSKVSGILSPLQSSQISISDLTEKAGFCVLMISCDSANVNKAALKTLFAALHQKKTLLCVPQFCVLHALNNSTKWGLGTFSYGSLLRLSHMLEAVRHRNVHMHVHAMIANPLSSGDEIKSETAQAYYMQVSGVYPGSSEWVSRCEAPPLYGPPGENGSGADVDQVGVVWREFLRYVCGQRGTFSKNGVKDLTGEYSGVCMKLWPEGPPKRNDRRTCPPSINPQTFTKAIDAIFGRTVPIPVASRWYDIFYRWCSFPTVRTK